MSRRIVTKSEWARMHGWHPSNVSYLLKKGIISERQDGRLDLRQVEAQITEHTKRPTLFRSVTDAEFMEARILKMQWQTLIRETQIRRQLNLLITRRDHRVKLSSLRDHLQDEIQSACWDIALGHCPADGLLHEFHHSLRNAFEKTFQQIDLKRFECEGPPDWAQEFISQHGFLNEI